ncbi:hypothetical protein CPAR01_16164 [Colletotrichum paranaense]|uniref:Uncharacterized protein n=1 Tax=Colletotrichum paranaense TaxID=1914294 RepID=A0ABQ9RWT8_9PEZI|nr:uncharacterized protein CPAR01_16164 [Colletotrichum paranaense]KAK1517300.1 hypothetical protein CPAR01_16164 [Colletotrichum paranaense]
MEAFNLTTSDFFFNLTPDIIFPPTSSRFYRLAFSSSDSSYLTTSTELSISHSGASIPRFTSLLRQQCFDIRSPVPLDSAELSLPYQTKTPAVIREHNIWYPYSKGMTPFERCKARWAMYARLGQGHAPGAVRGPPYNGRGTRSASRGGTAAVSGPHSISEGQVQLSQGGGHGQVGFHLGKALVTDGMDGRQNERSPTLIERLTCLILERPPSITFRYLILETSPPPAPPTVQPGKYRRSTCRFSKPQQGAAQRHLDISMAMTTSTKKDKGLLLFSSSVPSAATAS